MPGRVGKLEESAGPERTVENVDLAVVGGDLDQRPHEGGDGLRGEELTFVGLAGDVQAGQSADNGRGLAARRDAAKGGIPGGVGDLTHFRHVVFF
jgi:hypothetical protein